MVHGQDDLGTVALDAISTAVQALKGCHYTFDLYFRSTWRFHQRPWPRRSWRCTHTPWPEVFVIHREMEQTKAGLWTPFHRWEVTQALQYSAISD